MRTRLVGSLGAIGFLFPSLLLAGIVPVSRDSFVKVEGQALTDVLSDFKSSDQFGVFNEEAHGDGGESQGTHASGNAMQNSLIDATQLNRLGGTCDLTTNAFAQFNPNDTSGPLMVRATTELNVIFQITDQAELFELTGAFASNDNIGATAHVSLVQQNPPPGQGPVDFHIDNAVGSIVGGGLDFSVPVTHLPVGTYKLFADSASGSSGSGRGDPFSFGQDTGVQFTFSVGQGAQAIPLPAAVWPGAIALLGTLGRLTYRRRNS